MSLEKALNFNFLTGSLCGVEDKHRCLFLNGIYIGEKKNLKTSGCGTAGISESESGLQLHYALRQ